MNDREQNWPLVFFTLFGPISVGGLLGTLILDAVSVGWVYSLAILTVALVIGVVALPLSVAHLHKPLRAYRALRGFPKSALSREVVAFGCYLALFGLYWLSMVFNLGLMWLGVIAFLAGVAATVATAQVYLLPGRPSWYHWSTVLAFLSCGLSVGLATILSFSLGWLGVLSFESDVVLLVKCLALLGVVGSVVAIWQRTSYLSKGNVDTRYALRIVESEFGGQWQARLAIGLIVPILAVVASFAYEPLIVVGWLGLVIGEFLDRKLFFISSVPLSFRTEVTRNPQASCQINLEISKRRSALCASSVPNPGTR